MANTTLRVEEKQQPIVLAGRLHDTLQVTNGALATVFFNSFLGQLQSASLAQAIARRAAIPARPIRACRRSFNQTALSVQTNRNLPFARPHTRRCAGEITVDLNFATQYKRTPSENSELARCRRTIVHRTWNCPAAGGQDAGKNKIY